jgi:hypothetical protein
MMAPSLAEIWLESVLGPKPAHLVQDSAGVLGGPDIAPLGNSSIGNRENSGDIALSQDTLLNEFVNQNEKDHGGSDPGSFIVGSQVDILHDVSLPNRA